MELIIIIKIISFTKSNKYILYIFINYIYIYKTVIINKTFNTNNNNNNKVILINNINNHNNNLIIINNNNKLDSKMCLNNLSFSLKIQQHFKMVKINNLGNKVILLMIYFEKNLSI